MEQERSGIDRICCCMSLHTAGILIGCLGIISGIVRLIVGLSLVNAFIYWVCGTTNINVTTIIVFAVYLCGIFFKKVWLLLPAIICHMGWNFVGTYFIAMILGNEISSGSEIRSDGLLLLALFLTILVLYWYLVVVSILLFIKMLKGNNNVTNQGAVYHTAVELTNLNQENVEAGATAPNAKYTQ